MRIEEIIAEDRIKILFQPIISTYYDKVAGVEALARGIDEDGNYIPPLELFQAAKEAGVVIELDRLCQRLAIDAFALRKQSQKDLILFLNVDNSVIHLDNNTNAISEYVSQSGVEPGRIVLEINELQTADIRAVRKFVKAYRDKGFMISIDDIGSGCSNLDRIIYLKPDIVKIDRHIIQDVHKHYFKQQVVEMIIRLSEKTGAIVVAEGLEHIEEITSVLKYGAQLLQGFYISEPLDMQKACLADIEETINEIAVKQKEHLSSSLVESCHLNARLRDKFSRFSKIMVASRGMEVAETLSWILEDFPGVECAYVINGEGIQMTDTVFNRLYKKVHTKCLFSPYKAGDNATLKDYYYVLKTTQQSMFVSDEYLSLATGRRCITISGYSRIAEEDVILCLDVASRDV